VNAPFPEDCPMLQPQPEDTNPSIPLRDEIRLIAAEAARAAMGDQSGAHSTGRRSHMRLDTQALAIVVLAIIGGIVWLVRLEGRINAQDVRMSSIESMQSRANSDLREALTPVINRLDRIENRLDEAYGGGNGRRR
jgi:hypothetical protein